MKRTFVAALAVMFALTFAGSVFAGANDPNWMDINDIVPGPGQQRPGNVDIDEDLSGYHAPTDAGTPYAIGYVGHESDTYCNTDREIVFYNWVSVAQWMRVVATDIDRHIMIRKPGTYTFTNRPMQVRIASNGDVLVAFQELYGDNWDAEWYEFVLNPGSTSIWDKKYPQLANELSNQIPVDKQYKVTITQESLVDGDEPAGWEEKPATNEHIKFLNNEALHHLQTPDVGFDMQFKEIVVPCNTTGDYVLKARMVFQCANQMWYIDPATGAIDGTRDASLTPPDSYPGL